MLLGRIKINTDRALDLVLRIGAVCLPISVTRTKEARDGQWISVQNGHSIRTQTAYRNLVEDTLIIKTGGLAGRIATAGFKRIFNEPRSLRERIGHSQFAEISLPHLQ